MGYVFDTQKTATTKITDTEQNNFNLVGINATSTNAESIRAGLSEMLNIVNWSILDVTRVVSQDIVFEEEG